jgi:undecaprenyl-diphosphatase
MFVELKPYLDWLFTHPEWAGIVTCLVCFLESLAIIGLFIPGTVMMTAIGALIGTGYMPLVGTLLWAIAGAILGDVLSFGLGYHFHDRVRLMWPLSSYPKILQKGEAFFQAHGGKSVFLGRFVGPVRPVLPLIAGMVSMSPARFILVDILSAIVWAPVYLLPGFLVGTASHELAPEMATRFILGTIAIVLLISCISWLLQRLYNIFIKLTHNLLTAFWNLTLHHPRLLFMQKILLDPKNPGSPNQLGLALLLMLILIALSLLTYNVITHGFLTNLNEPVYYFMRSLRNTTADHVFVAITLLSAQILLPMWFAILAWLVWKKHWYAAFHWLAIGVACIIILETFKHTIHSPRPPGLVKTPQGWSFPSAHTTFSFTIFGFLAVLLCQQQTYIKRLIISIGLLLPPIAIAFSRLYLTAHWLTDVIGGVLLASALVLATFISYRRKITQPIAAKGILLVAILALSMSWSLALYYSYSISLKNYMPLWPSQTINTKQWWLQTSPQLALYRKNRFGKSIEVLNVQWAGALPNISSALIQQGWNPLPKHSLILAINGLASKDYSKKIPILSELYENHAPVLFMTKLIKQPHQALLVLRLWNANLKLDNGQSLWLGTIGYYKPWHTHFLKHPISINASSNNLTPPMQMLIADLKMFNWKKITYPISFPVSTPHINWDGTILLVSSP